MHSICAARIILQIRRAGMAVQETITRDATDASFSTGIMLDTLAGSHSEFGVHSISEHHQLQENVPELEGGWMSRRAENISWFGETTAG